MFWGKRSTDKTAHWFVNGNFYSWSKCNAVCWLVQDVLPSPKAPRCKRCKQSLSREATQ